MNDSAIKSRAAVFSETDLVWGCSDGCRFRDPRDGRVYEFSASGRIRFSVFDEALFREKFLCLYPACADREELRFWLRDHFRAPAERFLTSALSDCGYTMETLYEMTEHRLHRLSRIFYGKAKNVFAAYGMELASDCETDAVSNFVLIDR
ncbi:MAG: hypothetical protein IJD59_00865 [Clostridia bacterium]|nr:hypothetical protein [Clostridia bacterium]